MLVLLRETLSVSGLDFDLDRLKRVPNDPVTSNVTARDEFWRNMTLTVEVTYKCCHAEWHVRKTAI